MDFKIVNINGEHKLGCMVRKDFHGKKIELLIVKKKEYKNYDLYTFYKNIDGEYKPLYDETFTSEQLRDLAKEGQYGKNLRRGVSNG